MMRQIWVSLLLGALAGGIIISLYHAARIEKLYWENEKLKVELFETTDRLLKLESRWLSHEEWEIMAVNLEWSGDITAFTELELTKKVHEITGSLVGQRIDQLNPRLLIPLLHQRKLTVDNKDYLITVNWVVIAEEILFNLTASPPCSTAAPPPPRGRSAPLHRGGRLLGPPDAACRASVLTARAAVARCQMRLPQAG